MKTSLISFATIIILSSFVSAQNELKYYHLYNNYLPEQYKVDKSFQESIDQNLKSIAQIHSDLIYYYLQHLMSLSMKISNPDSNYSHLFNYNRKRLQRRKSNWALEQNNKISDLTDLRIMRNGLQSYLDDYIIYYETSNKISSSLQVDTNKIDFFNYIYFTGKSNSEYNPETNYYDLAKNAVKKIVTELNDTYKDLTVLSKDDKTGFVEKIADYWYLVDTTTFNRYNLRTNFDAYSVIYNSFYKEYKTYNSIILEAGIVKNLADQKFSNRFEYEASYIVSPASKTIILEPYYIFKPIANIGLGYKLKLKEEKTFLSYIDIKVFYTIYDVEEDTVNKTFFEFSGAIQNEGTFTVTYSFSDKYDLNSNAFSSSINLPVLYISKAFFFEVGVQLNYYHLSYKFDITAVVEHSDPSKDSTNTITQSYDESTFKPNGLIGINYQLWDDIRMRLEFVSNISFNYSLSYSFKL